MKRLISAVLSFVLILSLFSGLEISALTSQKYLVDMIAEGSVTLSDPDQYTAYQCDSAVQKGYTSEGVVRIGDGSGEYVDYSNGFRYHAASGETARTMSFQMPEGYNTISGVAGVCSHVPSQQEVEEGAAFYNEECYVTITVNSASYYNSGNIMVKTGYPFKVRAEEGSNVIISIINTGTTSNHCHVVFGDAKVSNIDYPDIKIDFDKPVYRKGDTINALVSGSEVDACALKWTLDGVELEDVAESYVIKDEDWGKTLRLTAYDSENAMVTSAERFLSKLTVVSVNTSTGEDVTSKEDYIDADLKIYGNEEFDGEIQYDGLTEIRGRGNTSWTFPKKSYKLKLDKKTDLCGMGKNKHWTLISCYWDENFLRNKMSYDLSGEMGLNYAASVWVDVYLNGNYHGVYLLCEHIRVDDTRVDIYDWEGTAEDVAKAIYKANKDTIADKGDFEDYMNENLGWVTSGEVTYEGNTYKVADYYEDEIPDINGGYLLEMDTHRDEVSNVVTASGLNTNIKNPEFCNSNAEMLSFVQNYLQAVENACISEDYTTMYNGERVRYTDLCDLDSMVKWWMVNELFFNWDAGYNSNFMYMDIGTKLYFGPVWDMDITAAGYGTSYLYDQWQTWYYKRSQCMNLWFKEAVADPVFLSYAHEIYWEYHDEFEALIADDGYMEKSHELLYESGLKNTELWRWRKGYEYDYQLMKEWMQNRLQWLDTQFATEESLIESIAAQTSADGVVASPYSSIEAYENSEAMTAEIFTASGTPLLDDTSSAPAMYTLQTPDSLENQVVITDSAIATVKREINGANPVTVSVENGEAKFPTIEHTALVNDGQKSVILYTGYTAEDKVVGKVYATVNPIECEHKETGTELRNVQTATCYRDAYSGDTHCKLCGELLEKGVTTPTTIEHSLQSFNAKAPTCTEKGWNAYVTCENCDYTTYEEIPATGKHTAVAIGTAKAATCAVDGITAGKKCSVCKATLEAQKKISATGKHTLDKGTVTKKATYDTTGVKTYKCTVCKKTVKNETIKKLAKTSLAKAKITVKDQTYSGKEKKPSITVKLGSKTLKKGTDYTVSYKNNKKIGKATVTIKGIKKYSGSVSKTFKINPKKVSNLKLKSSKKKQLTVSWKKDSKVTGYQIVYATNSKFTKGKKTVTVKSYKTYKKTIKSLKSKKTYYVKVRSYKTVSGKKYYSAYTSYKKLKIK